MNGEMLRPEQGYPVRLVVPGWEGNVWIKWLRRLRGGAHTWFTREETRTYPDLESASGAGLSRPPCGAGMGGQCLDQVAAQAESWRPALVHARGNREIHRP